MMGKHPWKYQWLNLVLQLDSPKAEQGKDLEQLGQRSSAYISIGKSMWEAKLLEDWLESTQ